MVVFPNTRTPLESLIICVPLLVFPLKHVHLQIVNTFDKAELMTAVFFLLITLRLYFYGTQDVANATHIFRDMQQEVGGWS